MIYSVNFVDLTEKINPLAFSKYLKDTGWSLFPSKKTYIKTYQLEKNDDFYLVIIPVEKRLADWLRRKKSLWNR